MMLLNRRRYTGSGLGRRGSIRTPGAEPESLTGAAWDPSLLPSALLWWRGDLGIQLGVGGVDTWTDQISGEVLTALSTGSLGRPDVVTRGGAQALYFDGDPVMDTNPFVNAVVTRPFSWIMVREYERLDKVQVVVTSFSGDNANLIYYTDSRKTTLFDGGFLNTGNTPSGQQVDVGSFGTAGKSYYVDNLTTAEDSDAIARTGTPTEVAIPTNNPPTKFEGWIWEFIWFNGDFSALSSSDLTKLGDYLNARYSGLTLTY